MRGDSTIILGSNGFIGKNLVELLPDSHLFDLNSGENICDYRYLNMIFKMIKPKYVIHLAAQSKLRESFKNPIYDATTNIIGSLNVLECCKNHKVRKIIYASTGGARYGEYNKLVNESVEPKPISPYGISKHTVEHYLEFYNKQYGLEYVTLCFGNVFGEYDKIKNNRIITSIINSLIKDIPLTLYGDGSQERDFIYVKDLVNIIVKCLDNTIKNKIYNVSSGNSHSINHVINLLEKITNKKCKINRKNENVGEVNKIYLNCTLAIKELELKITDFELALEQTYNWYIRNRK